MTKTSDAGSLPGAVTSSPGFPKPPSPYKLTASPPVDPSAVTPHKLTWLPNLIRIAGESLPYPDEATQKKLFVITARDPATQRILNRLWTRVKTGK